MNHVLVFKNSQGHGGFFPMSSKSVTVLACTFGSLLLCFELMCIWCETGVDLYSFACGCPVVAPLADALILLAALVKSS